MPQTDSSKPATPDVPTELPPRQRIEAAIKRYGEWEVVDRSLALMAGDNEGDEFLLYVGGEHAKGLLDGAPVLYWPELWGLRALLFAWDESAAPDVIKALSNSAWRVREMAARVVLARELPARDELLGLLSNETPRVRIAATRALGAVGELEDVESMIPLFQDPEVEVRRGAKQSIDALRKRFRG